MAPKPTALAVAAAKIPALAALGEMWQQRDGESDQDYWAFHDWLDRKDRGAPPAEHLQTAVRYEWAERAVAFERANELQRKLNDGTGRSAEQQVVDNLTAMVQIEAQKILERSAKDPGAVVSLKDLLATINLMAELQKKALQTAAATKYDYSKLTTDELRTFMALVKKMAP